MVKSPDAFRTISEVADWLGIQAHVLRFWESKFTQVKPIKRAGGRRYYRPADMLLLGGIKKLLHDDGLTIKGVQKILREEGMTHVSSLSAPLDELDFVEPRPAPKPDIIRPETGVVLNFGAKTEARGDEVSAETVDTRQETTAELEEAAPAAAQRPSPMPPADDHPRATPDPLAPSDSNTPDAPQLPASEAKPEEEPASETGLPEFLKRPLAAEPEKIAEVSPAPAEAEAEDPADDTPKPAIIDLPDFTPEADFPARPGLLSVGARVHRLPRDVQPQVAGLLLDLAELRARMAAEAGAETNF
ncbi:MerR family transcriptional regulator [Sulfitobacter sp. KE29]|uniref:MerR family transcriptional regulator n=1 Tax=Sulfitobacter TaxID=60136 RepID=UPI00082B058E|nr:MULTISPECIES: MerR family transcriptional regulator [Sulfitobacter]MBO9437646.1 MerR family transcriptional regulator [Sulfitobacter sp. R18_2]MDF3417171.1 MerR family transcriptional regulator [Sulfitobacter sp. Ks38]MDF3424653.1 MerR family transcriptional regulator [Sulfitobacter sp. KE29]MDF3428233.1 MerR family transcriptional regulator [Sulfitobacter sp. S46]MDF3443005.1 MerR family transcriptional regulator [Sulfitobacter sp. KE31]